MAPMVQEPEIQFAQRLASNEKPIRTKAIKKLRKYLSVRSQKAKGGFTIDELLKIWKGLFYCLWMQDKPLLQEELSTQISNLIHCLQSADSQFLFLESFLRTINREWNGIDRLRMDKFYSLLRFVFRQTFEMMKRREWEESLVQRFTEMLAAQVFRSTSGAPAGVQFHILDIYLAELAKVGASELTADQNLAFIEPFCKTAAKTKDHTLLQAIVNSVFGEIVDQAPFAIEDLMREVCLDGEGESDSGRASDEEDPGQVLVPDDLAKPKKKLVTGVTAAENEDEDDDDVEEDDDDSLGLRDETGDIGPVLQFDYKALADRLMELASYSNTPAFNRKKLYKTIKTFQNLSEGVFPQDEYPEEVSTDEDDEEMFGSRRRMKKRRRNRLEEPEEDEDGSSAAKKHKGQRKEPVSPVVPIQDLTEMTAQTDISTKKKKKKKKKKRQEGGQSATVEVPEKQEDTRSEPPRLSGETAEEPGIMGRQSVHSSTEMANETGGEEASLETPPPNKSGRAKKRRNRKPSTPQKEGPPETEPSNVGEEQENETRNRPEGKGLGVEIVTDTPPSQGANKSRKKGKRMPQQTEGDVQTATANEIEGTSQTLPLKRMKMKRKKAVEVGGDVTEVPVQPNGHPEEAIKSCEEDVDSTPVRPTKVQKKAQKKKMLGVESDFKFCSPSIPTPLFCRKAKGSPGTPLSSQQVNCSPQSETKKVTFGLKNNKTAEFRKTDRSLLVSPVGSSRVPFDPQQKPLFGVLKSPAGPAGARNHKTNSATKRRPRAADFF